MEAKVEATQKLSYDVFEPYCNWRREEARDTLVVHLSEFKREQLKVQINNLGILKISGERAIDAKRGNRFYKEVKIPKECNANEINAKFVDGLLHVEMPKKMEQKPQPMVLQQLQGGPQNPKPEIDQNSKTLPTQNATVCGLQPEASRSKRFAKLAITVTVAMAMISALAAYLMYKYRRSHNQG